MRLATNVFPTPPLPCRTKWAFRIGLFLSSEEAGSKEPVDFSFLGDRAVSEGASRLLVCGMGWRSILWCGGKCRCRCKCVGPIRRRCARIARGRRRFSASRPSGIGVPADELAEAAVADVDSRHVALVDCLHRLP